MTRLTESLEGVTQLSLDTAPIIYFVEAYPHYDALVTNIFQRIANGDLIGVTSVISLTEVLVQPVLHANTALQRQYRDLLLHSRYFRTLPINSAVAEKAAEMRARYRLRTPDALQIALALITGCEAFLTNDATLRRVTDLRVVVLDDLKL